MRILLVKLSSMGDVIHNLPVVSDIAHAFPHAAIDWVTESAYVELVKLHPRVRKALPINLRTLKKQWWKPERWSQLAAHRAALSAQEYDAIIDTQGLVKSAIVAAWANGERYGMSSGSAREPLAAKFYQHRFHIAKNEHAVMRNRQLAAAALGYRLNVETDYGLIGKSLGSPRPEWLPNDNGSSHAAHRYIVFLHATSRPDKQWPTAQWIALGKKLQALGFILVLPWGSATEKQTSDSLAALLAHSIQPIVPPAMALTKAATMLAGAAAVVGVDTGLAHLAVALGRPTVGLYMTTSPHLTGLFGAKRVINLGGGTKVSPANPSIDEVFGAVSPWVS